MKDFFNLRESLTEDHLKIGQKVKTSDGKVGTVRAAGKGDYIIAVDGKTMSCNKSDLTVVESTDINENYRTLARAGMGTESKGEARVGLELDYYDGSGTKRMGKITKVGPKGYIVKDEKDGKNRQFTFHDRAKAKEILARLGKGKYNESVELGESADFMKMSKELLKHKSKGIEYEKAAAYVRAIHNNSNVNVQDKAFMGLMKMLKDMDDFTKRTTITKILKDNGFKVKGGKLVRESVELGESPAEAQAIIDGRKAARQGKKYSDNPHKKGSKEFTAWSKGHNQGRTTHKESAEENLDEISTSLLKRARDKASKNTVDARDSASRNTKKHLKDPESGHGIKALKDYDKADKSRRQKKHFDKALKKRSVKESVELDESKTVKVSRADFDKLKKGSVIDVDWDGAMSAGAAALKVVSKSRSAKYDVEKIKLMPTSGGRSAPFYLYSRKGGDATLAIGDMGASMTKYKIVKESVELDEAVAKVKTTMPDKVASGAQRFGLKATTKGGHVSISGSKGKLNDFMRAIIGRSTYGNASDVTESVDPIVENYRILAKHGMGAETKNTINVGRGVDYYQADGAKYMGKITKITKTGYVVKDEKDGKSRAFAFYDRAKAKELLAK